MQGAPAGAARAARRPDAPLAQARPQGAAGATPSGARSAGRRLGLGRRVALPPHLVAVATVAAVAAAVLLLLLVVVVVVVQVSRFRPEGSRGTQRPVVTNAPASPPPQKKKEIEMVLGVVVVVVVVVVEPFAVRQLRCKLAATVATKKK